MHNLIGSQLRQARFNRRANITALVSLVISFAAVFAHYAFTGVSIVGY